MKLKIIIYGTLFIVLITGALFYFNRSETLLGNFDRKWRVIPFQEVNAIKTPRNSISIAHYHNRIFLNRVYDVIEIDDNGKTKNVYQIKDSKYKVNQNIIGLDADSSGLYLQDADDRTLTKIDYASNVVYQGKTPGGLFRSVYLNDDQFLIKTGSLKDRYANNFFSVYNVGKSTSNDLVGLLPKNGKGGLDTDGLFVKNSESIYHFYFFMSKVFKFDKHGKSINDFNTIDGNNAPPPVVVSENGFISSPDAKVIHTAGFADNTSLYIISAVRSKDMTQETFDANHIVDVYSLTDNKYSYSFLLPNPSGDSISALSIADKNIYTVTTKKNLVIYKKS